MEKPLERTATPGCDSFCRIGFLTTVDVGQFFRTRVVCEARGRSTAPYCKDFTKLTSIGGSRTIRNIIGTTKIGPVLDVFVSKDPCLLCIDVEVSSPVHDTAWIRTNRAVTQWSRQSSEHAPDIEGMDTVFMNGGAAVAHAQPKHPGLCLGRPCVFHPTITPPPPSDRLRMDQPGSVRPGIGEASCISVTVSARERRIETPTHIGSRYCVHETFVTPS